VEVTLPRTTVWLRFDGGSHAESYALRLSAVPSPGWLRDVAELDNRTARDALRTRVAQAPDVERSLVLFELARREYRLGENARGAELLRSAAALARRNGQLSLARRCLCLLANYATNAHDFSQSRQALIDASAVPEPSATLIDGYGHALVQNSYGVYYAELADLRRAAEAYEHSREWVERGAEELRGHVGNGLAWVSLQQGRLLDAARLYLAQVESEQARREPCFQATALSHLGWVELELLRAAAANRSAVERVTSDLRRAVALYATCPAAPPWRKAHARLNLAFDALRRGALEEAREGLEQTTDLNGEPRLRAYRDLLAAELALASGEVPEALRLLAALRQSARETLSLELEWRTLEVSGRASLALGQERVAVETFEEAERVLSQSALRLPVESGRLPFLGTHEHSAFGLSTAYLALGRLDRAQWALRRAARRQLISLAQAADREARARGAAWERAWSEVLEARAALEADVEQMRVLPEDQQARARVRVGERQSRLRKAIDAALAVLGADRELDREHLREPGAGELLLIWSETAAGSLGIAQLDGEFRFSRAATLREPGQYLDPFAEMIARARKLTVLGAGGFARADLAPTNFRGAPLIEHLEIAQSLDLPELAHAASRTRTAVVAGDARGDLPHARAELDAVASELRAHGFSVEVLVGEALRAPAWQRACRGVELFHYAGHGRFDRARVFGSTLAAAGGELTIADILALAVPPAQVVLSACEVGQAAERTQAPSLGVAQAFVLAGSQAVVAASREVSDRDAAQFARALARGLAAGLPLTAAYRSTLRQLVQSDLDWGAYRLLEP
jgi:tetratricopeptide (TPR) repeat protein